MKKYIIITSINEKTKAISEFEKMKGWQLIVVGDVKSKPIENSSSLTFLSIEDQKKLGYHYNALCPENHYARKNIGYLYALENGAEVIYDTDDDNDPYAHWHIPDFFSNLSYVSNSEFVNTYNYFSDELIWPRGFPLDRIHSDKKNKLVKTNKKAIGVWQGLADNEPDVDAVFRLVFNKNIVFQQRESVHLRSGQYCPFNSQNTAWNKKCFPLLYLPSTVSFRVTDILRGYIAQRLMWENDFYLGFISATVYQNRNIHNLIDDFKDEVPIFLNIHDIVGLLSNIQLSHDYFQNIIKVYNALSENGIVQPDEIELLQAWISDYHRINNVT
jgi:hypothetical protein